MNKVSETLKKCAADTGFVREVFDDTKAPVNAEDVIVIPFFGDIRSTFIFSTLLCKRMKELNSSKYVVVATWPGHKGLYPYADECWSLANMDKVEELYNSSDGFENSDRAVYLMYRVLNRYFTVVGHEDIEKYYHNGLTTAFWKDFKFVERSFPSVPSVTILGEKFNSELQKRPGFKVFICPSKWITYWNQGKLVKARCPKDFWVGLVSHLLENEFVPIIHFGPLVHDISDVFVEKCVYLNEPDITKVMGAMRAIGCTLDVFSDFSRISMMARCPYVSVTERGKHASAKDFELDGLCGKGLPKEHIFYFPTIIDNKQSAHSVYEIAATRLKNFIPNIDFGALPPASESSIEVSYDEVKRVKRKKRGARFIRIPIERELDG